MKVKQCWAGPANETIQETSTESKNSIMKVQSQLDNQFEESPVDEIRRVFGKIMSVI